jgi:hypothetical protein
MHFVDDSDVSHAVNSKIVHTNSHTYYLKLYQKIEEYVQKFDSDGLEVGSQG